jgi:uncharacterized protein
MLTGDLIRPRLRMRGSTITVETVDTTDSGWQQTAADLIALFAEHVGRTRSEWDKSVERYEGERTDYLIIRGLAKVLADSATFEPQSVRIDPVELRQRVFGVGIAYAHTDVFHQRTRADLIAGVAVETGLAPDEIEAALYADRVGEYTLVEVGAAWTPADLLARYNLELARGVLYYASEMTISIHDNYKDFWRYLKLFKLMFEVTPLDDGYNVVIDGAISPFVHNTRRYGRNMAAFLPALFLGERWHMHAAIHPPRAQNRQYVYTLDSTAPYTSHFKGSGEFDSRLEADFAAEFADKFGDKRSGWTLTREDEVIPVAGTVMIPDFALTHTKTGKRILVEIVGYWHPDYLRRKLAKVRAAGRDDLILLVYEGVNLSPDALNDVPSEVLYFARKPVIKEVIALASTMVGS